MKSNTSNKKKPFKLGSKARKALKASRKSASGGEFIEEKTTKSFRYDEDKDEELKRLRELYSSGAVGEEDDVTENNNNWHAIDVNSSQFLVGSSEEGFVSLEVLSTEKEGEKDDAKTKKTGKKTVKKSASKNDNNDDGSITVRKENEKEND